MSVYGIRQEIEFKKEFLYRYPTSLFTVGELVFIIYAGTEAQDKEELQKTLDRLNELYTKALRSDLKGS